MIKSSGKFENFSLLLKTDGERDQRLITENIQLKIQAVECVFVKVTQNDF